MNGKWIASSFVGRGVRVDEGNNNGHEMRNGPFLYPSAKVDVGFQESVKSDGDKL